MIDFLFVIIFKCCCGFLIFFCDVFVIVVIVVFVLFVVKSFVVWLFYIFLVFMECMLFVNDCILVDEFILWWMLYECGVVVVFKDLGGWLDG